MKWETFETVVLYTFKKGSLISEAVKDCCIVNENKILSFRNANNVLFNFARVNLFHSK